MAIFNLGVSVYMHVCKFFNIAIFLSFIMSLLRDTIFLSFLEYYKGHPNCAGT